MVDALLVGDIVIPARCTAYILVGKVDCMIAAVKVRKKERERQKCETFDLYLALKFDSLILKTHFISL